jgi:hypothetical protein
MASHPAASGARRQDLPSIGYPMAAIVLAALLVGLAAAYGLNAWLHRPPARAAGEPTVTRSLVGRDLAIPQSWFRDGPPPQQGFATEIDLRLMLPLGPAGRLAPVAVTLLPLSQVKPSASLLDGVYLGQFMPNELSGPPGLVGKPLYPHEGFEGETVWYDALSQNPFVAKCSASLDGNGPGQCLRSVALPHGLGAVYAFGADLLPRWKDFDPLMQVALARIGAL